MQNIDLYLKATKNDHYNLPKPKMIQRPSVAEYMALPLLIIGKVFSCNFKN